MDSFLNRRTFLGGLPATLLTCQRAEALETRNGAEQGPEQDRHRSSHLPAEDGERERMAAERRRSPNDPDRPHVLFFVSDDQPEGIWRALPKTVARFEKEGTSFAGICANPVCAPARASLISGRRSDKTNIQVNVQGVHGVRGSTIFRTLRQRGYRTALLGKYENGYRKDTVPGVDRYVHQDAADCDALLAAAESFLDKNQVGPVMLYVAPHSPHEGGKIPDRYKNNYRRVPEPERTWLQRARAVDDLFDGLMRKLRQQNRLNRTVVFFVSDNGHHLGDLGLFTKGTYFDQSLRVTAYAMGAGIPRGNRSGKLLAPEDVPVTIAALCGTEINGATGVNALEVDREHVVCQYHQKGPDGRWWGLAYKDRGYFEREDGGKVHLWTGSTTNTYGELTLEEQQALAETLARERAS